MLTLLDPLIAAELMDTGPLMFTEHDVEDASCLTAKKLRQFFYQNKITERLFYERYEHYMLRIGKKTETIRKSKSNIRNQVKNGSTMTVKTFETVVYGIFGAKPICESLIIQMPNRVEPMEITVTVD